MFWRRVKIFYIIIAGALITNALALNYLNKSIEALVMIPFYGTFSLLRSLGLDVSTSSYFTLPNTLGYTLIFLFDAIAVFIIAFAASILSGYFLHAKKKKK